MKRFFTVVLLSLSLLGSIKVSAMNNADFVKALQDSLNGRLDTTVPTQSWCIGSLGCLKNDVATNPGSIQNIINSFTTKSSESISKVLNYNPLSSSSAGFSSSGNTFDLLKKAINTAHNVIQSKPTKVASQSLGTSELALKTAEALNTYKKQISSLHDFVSAHQETLSNAHADYPTKLIVDSFVNLGTMPDTQLINEMTVLSCTNKGCPTLTIEELAQKWPGGVIDPTITQQFAELASKQDLINQAQSVFADDTIIQQAEIFLTEDNTRTLQELTQAIIRQNELVTLQAMNAPVSAPIMNQLPICSNIEVKGPDFCNEMAEVFKNPRFVESLQELTSSEQFKTLINKAQSNRSSLNNLHALSTNQSVFENLQELIKNKSLLEQFKDTLDKNPTLNDQINTLMSNPRKIANLQRFIEQQVELKQKLTPKPIECPEIGMTDLLYNNFWNSYEWCRNGIGTTLTSGYNGLGTIKDYCADGINNGWDKIYTNSPNFTKRAQDIKGSLKDLGNNAGATISTNFSNCTTWGVEHPIVFTGAVIGTIALCAVVYKALDVASKSLKAKNNNVGANNNGAVVVVNGQGNGQNGQQAQPAAAASQPWLSNKAKSVLGLVAVAIAYFIYQA